MSSSNALGSSFDPKGADFIADLKKYLSYFPHSIGAVLEHGRPYVGISRPKGYRKLKDKKCFYNAGKLALANRGTYVEGFTGFGSALFPIHHAWLTLDGEHAIDVTWADDPTDRL